MIRASILFSVSASLTVRAPSASPVDSPPVDYHKRIGSSMKQTPEEKANIATVEAFIAAWNAQDGDEVATYLADDFRFTFGEIEKTPEFSQPDLPAMVERTTSVIWRSRRARPGREDRSSAMSGLTISFSRMERPCRANSSPS